MADINDLKDICISSGTLRAEDLLPKFMGILKDYAPEKFNEFIKGYPELDGWEDFLEADWRIISDDTKMNASDDLFGLLNDIAPEGTMFSSTEGNGADFGFWTVEEKLLDDDEGEKALKQMAKDGKSTGDVAADIRYDVATALDMAADKAEDLMTKFGLDKIYVLRAQGLFPKAIAKKILKACESKDEGWLGGFYSRQDVLDAMDGGILNKDWKLEKRFGNWGCYVNQNTGRPLVLQVMVSQDRSGDWGYKPVTSDMGPVDTNIQAAKWLKPRLEEWVEKNPDLAKDVPDYEWGWIEKCLGKETANKDRKNLVSSLVKGDKIKLIDTVADGAVVTFIDMITPTKMRILHNGREMSCKTSFIDRKVEESKDERRDSADYLQEVWDALVSVWDKDKFDMAKGYDDEYECEAITITVKDNEGVRAKIYVDDHEGKHPVGFDVIYRYPGDKGVGDLGYYEFQSTDFDETAPEIFAYFDELKGKVGEAKGDNWVAYYFCEDPQGLEWAVLPHAINGIGNASCVNSRGGNDSIAIEYVLDECTPIEDVKGSDIYGKVKELEDRDIVALTRDEAERIALADDRLKELKAVVAPKDEAADSRRVDDYADKRFFDPEEFVKYVRKAYGKDGGYVSIDSVVPVSVLDKANRMAQKNGYKKTETKKSVGIRREALDDDPPEWREHGCASRVFLERFGVALRDSGLPWTLSIDNTIYDMVEVYTDISSLFGFKPSTEVGHIDYESKNVSGNDAILLDIVKECEEDIAPVGLAFDGHDGIMRWVTCYLPHASMEGGYAEHIEDDTWPTIPECIDMTLEALDTATNYLKKSASGLKSSESKKSESLTLKQKELKDMARYGEAEDITTISDAEAKELKKKGIETVGVSRGTYGMNGALLRDNEGKKYVITARSSNLFYFV